MERCGKCKVLAVDPYWYSAAGTKLARPLCRDCHEGQHRSSLQGEMWRRWENSYDDDCDDFDGYGLVS